MIFSSIELYNEFVKSLLSIAMNKMQSQLFITPISLENAVNNQKS